MSFSHNPKGFEIDPVDLADLTSLEPPITLSPEDIFPILRERFLEGITYTLLSAKVLVAINPQQAFRANSDSALTDWGREYADCGNEGVRGRLAPHLFEMSGRAYYYMRRTAQDQTILLSGETGAGKTEASRLLIKSLVDLSSPPPGKRGSKLAASIPAASFILDTFGHAATISNVNASRFGRYTELQFGSNGRLVGVKGLEYYLDKSRVTGASPGERNFHVFYYLMAGASPEERLHLHLDDSTTFRYLPHRSGSSGSSHLDATRFTQLKEAFKAVGFPKKAVAAICQILSAILHLGNLDFHIDRVKNDDSAVVKNPHVLDIVAEFLGVDAHLLEFALTNKSVLVGSEMCGVFLDAEAAAANRDDLARALYGLVFSWIGEFLNEKLCRDDFATFIALVDFPGPVHSSPSHREGCTIDNFVANLASERLHAFMKTQLFDADKAEYAAEGISIFAPSLFTPYNSNAECVRLLTNVPGGLAHIIDDQSRRKGKTDSTMLKAMSKRWASHASFTSREGDESLGRPGTFTVSHWDGQVTYSVDNFLAHNSSGLSPNFVELLGGSTPAVGANGRTTPGARDQLSTGGSSLSFVRQLFASGAVETVTHPRSDETIVGASQKVGPRRAPSTRRPKGRATAVEEDAEAEEKKSPPAPGRSIVKEFDDSITLLLSTLEATKSWHVFCIRPNDSQLPNQIDAKIVKHQIRALGLAELSKRLQGGEWTASLEFKEWWERYESVPPIQSEIQSLASLVYREKALRVRTLLGWNDRQMAVGKHKVFLNDSCFRQLEDHLRVVDPEEQKRNDEKTNRDATAIISDDIFSPYATPDTMQGYNRHFAATGSSTVLPLVSQFGEPRSAGLFDDDEYDRKANMDGGEYLDVPGGRGFDEERSNAPSESASRPLFDNKEPEEDLRGHDDRVEVMEEVGNSAGRRRWVILTWMFTWWIPSFFLSSCGGMKRSDIRMAWREKLLINMLIWLLCGAVVFVVAILGNLICPKEYVYSPAELSGASLNSDPDHMLVAIRGEAFDLTKFATLHQPGSSVIPLRTIQRYGGIDASSIFPVQVSALCTGPTGTLSPWITLDTVNSSSNTASQYHDFRAFTKDSRPDWYYETMVMLRYNFRKGFVGYTPDMINSAASSGSTIAIYDGGVYDLTSYIANGGGGVSVPAGQIAPSNIDRAFMSPEVIALFQARRGADLTKSLNSLNIDRAVLAAQKVCLRNLFFVGKLDTRNSVQCQFARYILLAFSIVMIAVIGFKFLAALQFGRTRKPEDYDKFVICQVPCYTEGEESLRNCINSLTRLKYDDKRKLLFIICDGMIIGSGNDRPTPQIVLEILGADMTIDPEPLSFQSLGDGNKQHNMAKVYSGLHEAAGHIVPYVVIVKVGKPSERSRPGNRGKRDSQMLLMRFLNRVHFDSPMSPCELEMYHQIKNVIGVNPSFYEYMLMVDADTVVDTLALNYLVGAFVEDKRVIGLCGETSLSNARASWTTMMQVYEYFISHYLSKAFESLFGSVTCLPGCFSIYRIRTLEHKPLIISSAVVREYGQNLVETLHVKNLLSLGEDRYLTTVMMKQFPEFKMKFCRAAQAQTIAPDEFKVLMSQRRRWINSTVHNLAELLFVDQLCGFCVFSMRFVVFIDLLSTLIAPVTVAYIGYLIYQVASAGQAIPTTALIMLGAIYGLQAIIYILHRKFEHIGWMIIYILAIPIFNFILPLASFWQMDDFSWGSTREIVGDKGKRMIIHDEGLFDPASIPLKSWQDFEQELWENGSNQSIGSLLAPAKQQDDSDSRYGRESAYNLPYNNVGGPGTPSPRRGSALFDQQSQHGQPQRGQSQFGLPSFGGSQNTLDQYGFGGGATNTRSTGRAGSNLGLHDLGAASRRASSAFHSSPQGSPRATSPAPSQGGGQLPPDEVIVADVERILASANLTTLSKKGVRRELEQTYGTELGPGGRALVNSVIERVLGLEG